MDTLNRLLLKTERARKHTLELESEFEEFLKTKPLRFETALDPATGDTVYSLARSDGVPLTFSAILGDALHNLRSSLDRLVHHLVLKGGGTEKQLHASQFPIYQSRTDYQSRSRERIAGMRPEAVSAIDQIEPYVGGNGEYLWHLACLSNIDKHRLLLTVWASVRGHSALASDREWIAKYHGGDPSQYVGNFVALDSLAFRRPPTAGDVLLRVPASAAQPDMRFLLQIAFGEPELVRGNPVTDTLHEMCRYVRHIIFDFDRQGLV